MAQFASDSNKGHVIGRGEWMKGQKRQKLLSDSLRLRILFSWKHLSQALKKIDISCV